MSIFILIIALLAISFINVIVVAYSLSERAQVLATWKVYLLLVFGGVWGMHSLYLRRFFWGGVTFIITLTLIIMNFSVLETYWSSPLLLFTVPKYTFFSEGLFWMLAILLLSDFISIPYYVYRFNNTYYRRHFETDAILKGEELEVDKFCKELSLFFDSLEVVIDSTHEVLSNPECIEKKEEESTSFWKSVGDFGKNILTAGNLSKLNRKKAKLKSLAKYCTHLKSSLEEIVEYNNNLSDFLKDARKASYRNLFLAKELIFIGKEKTESRKQTVVRDDNYKADKIKVFKLNEVEDINFQSELFFSNMGSIISDSLSDFDEAINIEEDVTKEDLAGLAVDIAIETLSEFVDHVFNMNKRTKEALIAIEQDIAKVFEYLEKSLSAILIYKASLLRQDEILRSLTACNKAFIVAYEPLREIIFGEPTLLKFVFKDKNREKYIHSVEFKKDIQHLILLCSEYNKINQSKVI